MIVIISREGENESALAFFPNEGIICFAYRIVMTKTHAKQTPHLAGV
jgi:hypothetical protein